MAASDIDTVCWNVRGLNSAKRCLAVHEMIASTSCHITCLQETKLQSLDSTLARFLGAYRLNQFTYKPAHGTKGGILALWNDNALDLQNIQIGRYSITATLTMCYSAASFVLTTIYGPSRRVEKENFLQHLRQIKPAPGTKWIVMGDFNIIYKARDKNNRNLNLRLTRRFRVALDYCELNEIHLQN
ncbi:hypothetical protein PVAP13_9NG494314 [Panicum virgatum]|uniref:Endonuclease/exonuclease/phosphatase domain-containing protein n=1 Tax=Panicum virgatum TaxID=38727 RepID=A0A8T0MW50_PANVG|nr:hypothetical protein PVAP13_9NG494314 [Panicum virgatum]